MRSLSEAKARRALFAGFLASASLAVAAQNTPKAGAPKEKGEGAVVPSQVAPQVGEIFGEWFAAGSGCKATFRKPGDVKLEVQGLAEDGKAIRGRFHLDTFKLSSPPDNPATSISFARECSLRVQVKPPAGKRVRGASAKTRVVVSKDAPVRVQLQNILSLDTQKVGGSFLEIPAGERVGNRDYDLVLGKGRWEGMPEQVQTAPPYECGAMAVFGFDYTIIAHRKEKSDSALIRVGGGPRTLDFAVELEDCAAGK